MRLQKLAAADLAEMYATLLREGRRHVGKNKDSTLSAGTVRYVHRVLHRALGHAVLWKLVPNNPADSVDVPKGPTREIQILTEGEVKEVLAKLRGRQMYQIALVGLATGLRRGEILAIRWKCLDLDSGKLRVEQSLEQTKKGTLRFKAPKTKYGRRTVSLPVSVIAELRNLRKAQAEERLSLGLGKEPADALVFRRLDGDPLLPNSVTTEWRRLVRSLGLPKVSLHAWRHTHASQLIASGMDVLTISRRMGHGSPAITLNVYGHLFSASDDKAAAIFERSFGGVVGG
jgi:integrase